jgi:flagellar biosynthetic protein FliO
MSEAWPALLSTILATALVLGLAWVTLRLWRQLMRSGVRAPAHEDRLHIVQTLALGPRERVVVLACRGRTYLLGLTPAGIQLLDTWPAAPDGTPPPDVQA